VRRCHWCKGYKQIHSLIPEVGVETCTHENLGSALAVANVGQFALLGFCKNEVNKRRGIVLAHVHEVVIPKRLLRSAVSYVTLCVPVASVIT